MEDIFNNAYALIAGFAAAVAMLWGLFKAIGAFVAWCKKSYKAYKERLSIPLKTLKAVAELTKSHEADMKRLNERMTTLEQDTARIQEELRTNNDQTATVMLEKMMWSYDYYVISKNKIPLSVRTALVAMYRQYIASEWHNHIPTDFEDRIMECDVI